MTTATGFSWPWQSASAPNVHGPNLSPQAGHVENHSLMPHPGSGAPGSAGTRQRRPHGARSQGEPAARPPRSQRLPWASRARAQPAPRTSTGTRAGSRLRHRCLSQQLDSEASHTKRSISPRSHSLGFHELPAGGHNAYLMDSDEHSDVSTACYGFLANRANESLILSRKPAHGFTSSSFSMRSRRVVSSAIVQPSGNLSYPPGRMALQAKRVHGRQRFASLLHSPRMTAST